MRRFTFSLGLLAILPTCLFSQPQVTGTWQTLSYLMPINPIQVLLLHTGKVLIVAGSENDPNLHNQGSSKAAIWDPQAGNINVLPNLSWDLFCNGMAQLPDGRAIQAGGTTQYDPFWGGEQVTIFDPATSGFIQVHSMAHGRWYATTTMLGDGRILAFSGYSENGPVNNAIELYKVASGWSQQYFAPFTPPLYPHLFLLPNGNVFYTGSGWSDAGAPNISDMFNPATQTWTMNVAQTVYTGDRAYGSAVLLPLLPPNYVPRVMILGGDSPATPSTEIIDLSASSPKWASSGNMTAGRAEMDAVLLPNGKVLAEGGSPVDESASQSTLAADLFDPATSKWSSAGTATYSRLYHSVALLMPDATVWVAGSNPKRGVYEQHMEIWTPPYLYTTDSSGNTIPAPRPSITTAPASIGYGGSFQVQTPDAANISSVALMRPGSSTHAFDTDQRLVGLTFSATSGALTINGPSNANLAPPGYYMLFILNRNGVPSVAKFMLVSNTPADASPKGSITSPSGNVSIHPGQSVSFNGSGTDPDGTVTGYSWVFPSGTPLSSSAQNPGAVTFPADGTYTASLTTVDNNGVNDPSPPTRTVTVSGVPYYVNAGGPDYTDPNNQFWNADSGSSGSIGTYSVTNSISGTTTPTLYQTERYGSTFQYQFSVPNGNYTVTLKFAEIYFSQAGQRVFNAAINGQTVLSKFDIVQAAGAGFTAIDKSFTTSVTGGQITIQFTSVVDNAQINAIQIVTGGSAINVAVSPSTVTLGQSQSQQFTATVSGTTNTNVTWSLSPSVGSITTGGLYTAPATITSSQNVTVTATSAADGVTKGAAAVTLSPPSGSFTPIRVDAGGPAYTDPNNQVWSADTGSSGSIGTYSVANSISGTTTPTLYQSERYGSTFQYQFSVPNGAYTVTLKFAEIYYTQAGQRVFNAAINGQTVLSNFDIVQAAGAGFTAIDKSFTASVTGGQITIQLTSVVDNAKISAIQIVTGGSAINVAVTPSTVTLGQSQSQQFTAAVSGTTNTSVTWSLSPSVGSITTGGLYTAPATITNSQNVTVTATSAADGVTKGSATVTLSPPSGSFTPIRVNAGGPAYTDPSNQVWSADTGSSGSIGTFITTNSISGTTTPTLYQSERYGSTFQYQFSVPNGAYTVTLKFAEIYYTQTGRRVFNVAINGQSVLSNFDIVQAAGAGFTAIDKSFTASVTGGQITIQFTSVVDNAKISAIQIATGGSAINVAVSPSTVTLGQSQSQQFTAAVSGTTNTSVTWSLLPSVGSITSGGLYTAPATITSSQNVTVTATSAADGVTKGSATVTLAPPSGSFTPIRVNAGGPAYTDPNNQVWSADTGSSGSIGTYSVANSISGTTTPTLYQSERYGSTFQYQFSVPNGGYTVTLKFAEIYFTQAGQRVFNVAINGQAVLSNFDIVQAAGAGFTAIDKSFNVSVTGGQITIQFTSAIDNAKISALQIQ